MKNEQEKELGLLKQRLLQQQEEIRQLKHDEKLLRQKNRRLVQKYGDLLYTFEWTLKALDAKEQAVQAGVKQYKQLETRFETLERKYRRLVQSKAGKAILKAQAVARRIRK